MVNEILLLSAKFASATKLFGSIAKFSNFSSNSIPALPGATKTLSTVEFCAIFHAIACSRPPEPINKISMDKDPPEVDF